MSALDEKSTLTRAERILILSERDGPDCFLCKRPFESTLEITLDHFIPQSKGGTWDIENLRLAHQPCNAAKGDTMPNADGTLPDSYRKSRLPKEKVLRPDVCQRCENGRLLGPDDYCDSCGSEPMPRTFPRWAKMRPSDCSHEFPFWCWMEALEPGLRKPAIVDVLDGESQDW